MSSSRLQSTAPGRPQRVLVWLLAGLVLALGLLTVSPAAHARLHEANPLRDHTALPSPDDTGCAVTLFQHGVTTPLDLPHVETPSPGWALISLTPAPDRLTLSAPRQLLRPARGPPALDKL